MPVIPANFFDQLGAELQTARGLEAAFEWMSRVSGGGTFFRDKLNAAYDNTIQREDDAEIASKESLRDSIQGRMSSSWVQRTGDFRGYFFAFMDVALNISQQDRDAGAITYLYDQALLPQGEVRIIERRGRWAALRRAMLVDAVTIKKNTITFGALTAVGRDDGPNKGVLAVDAAFVGADHALNGTLSFDVADDTVGKETLTPTNVLTNPLADATVKIAPDNVLQVGKFYEDGPLGFSGSLKLGPVVVTGDDGNIFNPTTDISVANRSEQDTAKGKLFITVERIDPAPAGKDFRVKWYRSGSLGAGDLVATLEIAGTVGNALFSMIGAVSTLTFRFDKTAAAVKLPAIGNIDNDIAFDLKIPRLGDRWSMTVTNTELGNFATKIAHMDRVSLSSADPGTIADAKAASVSMT